MPLLHTGERLFDEQAKPPPQPPQLLTSAPVCVSQPSLSLFPLQSVQPASQVPPHIPLTQVGAAMWLFEQSLKQPPPFLVSLLASFSHPSLRLLPLQSNQPGSQVPPQVLLVHVAPVRWLVEQA